MLSLQSEYLITRGKEGRLCTRIKRERWSRWCLLAGKTPIFRSLTVLWRMKRHLGYFRALYGFIPLFFSACQQRHEKAFSFLFVHWWFVFQYTVRGTPPQAVGLFSIHRAWTWVFGVVPGLPDEDLRRVMKIDFHHFLLLSLHGLCFFFIIIITIDSCTCCNIKTLTR